MSNFSNNPEDCRVDFFKPSGKWYETVSIKMHGDDYRGTSVHRAVENALLDAVGEKFDGMTVVCLEPYHHHSHPVMFTWCPMCIIARRDSDEARLRG